MSIVADSQNPPETSQIIAKFQEELDTLCNNHGKVYLTPVPYRVAERVYEYCLDHRVQSLPTQVIFSMVEGAQQGLIHDMDEVERWINTIRQSDVLLVEAMKGILQAIGTSAKAEFINRLTQELSSEPV